MSHWEAIATAISAATHQPFDVDGASPISGGDINQAWRIDARDGTRYFVKLNDARKLAMFEAESAGLSALAATCTVRVPHPVAHGIADDQAFLVLEHLDLHGNGDAHALGVQLAALHRSSAERFGFERDNTLGETRQPNDWRDDWIAFWREQRLGFQLELAAQNGYGGQLQKLGTELMQRLPEWFVDYAPRPSLLHGDLWGGNHAYMADGTPVIFDPAPYYGDREADLAMTELFGGFDTEFYVAYRAAWPLHAGYAVRKTLYNLYHILNHANHFHGRYAQQAEGMMQKLLH